MKLGICSLILFGITAGQEIVTQCQQKARDGARRDIKVEPNKRSIFFYNLSKI